jgi:large subunit ribosomal protein L22
MKRWRPRARGRVNRIRKRTCHITLELVEPSESRAPAARDRRESDTYSAEPPKAAARNPETTEEARA